MTVFAFSYSMFLQIWALMVLGGLLYWLPTIIAVSRKADSGLGIAFLNFLFGWTILGWLGALVWALCSTRETPWDNQISRP
jgi:hypothetical protein